jgi:hypothetical protein
MRLRQTLPRRPLQMLPPAMLMGAFLCLSSIEFDDLQSLPWLVGAERVGRIESPRKCSLFSPARHLCFMRTVGFLLAGWIVRLAASVVRIVVQTSRAAFL